MYFGDSAFWGCKNLEAIVIKAPLTKPDIQVFDFTNNCPIYVPDEGIERIKTIPHWPHWENRLVPMSQMPEDLITKCGEEETKNKTIVYYSPSILPESIYDATQGVHLGRFGNAVSYGQSFENGKGTIGFDRDLELVGTYAPLDDGEVKINEEVALKWLNSGAIPTDTVRSLFRKVGIMQKFTDSRSKKGE